VVWFCDLAMLTKLALSDFKFTLISNAFIASFCNCNI